MHWFLLYVGVFAISSVTDNSMVNWLWCNVHYSGGHISYINSRRSFVHIHTLTTTHNSEYVFDNKH